LDKNTNPWKDATITRQALEQHMEGEVSPWTLESPTTTSKTGSLSTSTATSMDTWPKNTEQRKKNERPEHVLNVTRKDISPETAKKSKQ